MVGGEGVGRTWRENFEWGGRNRLCCEDGEIEFTWDSSIAALFSLVAMSPLWLLKT